MLPPQQGTVQKDLVEIKPIHGHRVLAEIYSAKGGKVKLHLMGFLKTKYTYMDSTLKGAQYFLLSTI